ncbi:MAG: hypothetical protein II059_04210 [Clostridia bacterium]|nr:hypothetical protein [Clostridia bacterium]
MADIGEELLKAVRADFRRELGDSDSRLAKLLKRIQGGKGTMHDAALFSKECGAALSVAIAKNVVPENLPNGALYYNIAEKILGGTLRDNYDLLNMAAQAVQEQTDSKLNIRIEPQKAEFPQERVHKIINAAADQTADSETIKRRLDSPVRNVTESFFDDYVEENAKFRDEAGLQTYLARQTNGKCCDWCASLAGRFRYEDAPEEIFARHDNCTCTVDYITGTYRQDVWSKRKYALTPEQRKEILNSTPKPTRFTKEQAKNLQNQVLNGVANSGESGIIKEQSKKAISVITDKAIDRIPCVSIAGYTEQQNKYIQQQHKELLNFARSKNSSKEVAFVFSSDFSTRKEFLGSDDRISFSGSGLGMNIVVLHNHPRNSSYSLNDVIEFVSNSSIKTLTIVKNNGVVETLTKLQTVDKEKQLLELNRLIKKRVKNGLDSEYDKVVWEFLTKKSEGGVFEWLK